MSFKTVALLPIKAHSARVPGKNFRDFAGKPLFRWILETLLSVDEIEKIVINTDAKELLASHGLIDSPKIMLRDRKPAICGDMVSMNKVLADDVENVTAETYVMTHSTNPLLKAPTIRAALREFEDSVDSQRCDSLFSVTRYQTRFYREDGEAVNHDPGNLLRTQDLEPWFEENSNLYVFTRESFLRTNARIGEAPRLFETPRMESFDIDDQDGWDLAENIAKHYWQQSYSRLEELESHKLNW
ncbi:acylneuraminate cytidylyltransferase family protein [Roseiconus lacunae]|uniref:acylneuraminate cytidylyltransferase family protein n=1 Tax=Roseiconus lacunae TaxID=2605694 RepID=UPI001E4A1812|nr:acylneuraminate cytidylyltransferase family protein [Roseiconus lacunae]MCD0458882.1 acylneuraminate cytidylyltransferase family protein [Roseiconus lacunae]